MKKIIPVSILLFVFLRVSTAQHETKIVAFDAGPHDWFGFSVAVSGDDLLAGDYTQTVKLIR